MKTYLTKLRTRLLFASLHAIGILRQIWFCEFSRINFHVAGLMREVRGVHN